MDIRNDIITKQILEREKELEYRTDRYGVGSLLTTANRINASRAIMYNRNVGHVLNITDSEPPLTPTGFEAPLGNMSELRVISDGDYEIKKVFQKNQYFSIVIGYDKKRRYYHAWKVKPIEEQSEGFATKLTSPLNTVDVGDKIHKGDVIQSTTSFDAYGNYGLGRNLNTVYLISLMTMEDGIGLMNGAENMMDTIRCTRTTISLNEGDVLCNLYGESNKDYRGFPEVGERTMNRGVLCAVKTINPMKAVHALKGKHLKEIELSDRPYYIDGRVIDIIIRTNLGLSEIPDTPYNRRIKELLDEQNQYYLEVYSYMNEIIRGSDSENYTFSDMFSIISEECHDFIDSSAFFSDDDDEPYGNIRIEFAVMKRSHMSVGSKMVGRYGNKGTVSTIIPPEKSYMTEDGRPIHVIISAIGVIARLNHGQYDEHAVNSYAFTAVQQMKALSSDDIEGKLNILLKLLEYMNSDERDDFEKYFKSCSRKKQREILAEIENKGIIVILAPIDNPNMYDIGKAEKDFPTQWTRIVFKEDGSKSMRKVIVAPMYFLRVKQDPEEKYAVRFRGPVSITDDLPTKTRRKKLGTAMFSDVPVRVGNQEIEALLTQTLYPQIIARFMAKKSTLQDSKLEAAKRYYLDDIDDDDPMSFSYDDGDEKLANIVDIENYDENSDDDEYGYSSEILDFMMNVVDDSNDLEANSRRKNREVLDANLAILGAEFQIDMVHYDTPKFLDNISAMYLGDDVIYDNGRIFLMQEVDDDK